MQFMNDRERLVAEQAVLRHRAVMEAARRAEFGRGLEALETAVLEEGRRQQQLMLEQAMQAVSEKRTRPAAVRAASIGRSSSDKPSAS